MAVGLEVMRPMMEAEVTELLVVHPQRVSGLNQVVAQVAVTGFGQAAFFSAIMPAAETRPSPFYCSQGLGYGF